jgi:hypothetical protein
VDESGRRGASTEDHPDVVLRTAGSTKRFGRTVALRAQRRGRLTPRDLEVRMNDAMTAPDHRRAETVAFAAPYERDGATVITATATRAHTAIRGEGSVPEGRGFDAQMSGNRPMGAFVVRNGRVHWHPAVDLTRVVTTAEVVVGGVLIARQLAKRPGSAKALVTMGPGGWVSMKGGVMAVRPAERAWRRRRPAPSVAPTARPWWARLLSAKTLQSLLT